MFIKKVKVYWREAFLRNFLQGLDGFDILRCRNFESHTRWAHLLRTETSLGVVECLEGAALPILVEIDTLETNRAHSLSLRFRRHLDYLLQLARVLSFEVMVKQQQTWRILLVFRVEVDPWFGGVELIEAVYIFGASLLFLVRTGHIGPLFKLHLWFDRPFIEVLAGVVMNWKWFFTDFRQYFARHSLAWYDKLIDLLRWWWLHEI